MNQLKPYIYWIASGVALLILIVVAFVWSPSDPQLGDTRQVKQVLDTEYAKLEKLAKRAEKGPPVGLFDAENKQDIDHLTNDYLLTGKWLEVLAPHVSKYEQQLGTIQKDLVERSAPLHQEVSASHDLLGWYIAYESKTAQVVSQLLDAKAIVISERQSGGGGRAAPGNAGGAAGGAVVAAKDGPRDPATDAVLRESVGLFTRGETHPAAEEHPGLTTRFRIVERIAQVVLASAAESLPNPVIDPEVRVTAAPAFVRFEWTATPEALQPPVGNYATAQRCAITFQGSESALMALLASLESMEKPVAIVLGSTLSRLERGRAGARALKDAAREPRVAPMAMTVDLLVLDFSQMPALTTGGSVSRSGTGGPAAAAGPGAAAGRPPGAPGAGPGMMPNGPGMGGPGVGAGQMRGVPGPAPSGPGQMPGAPTGAGSKGRALPTEPSDADRNDP